MSKKIRVLRESEKHELPDELMGFSRQERFINREVSWLAFNERVLDEATNATHPVMERLRFLSISASNLDEFFMVRVAGLVGQTKAGVEVPSQDGLTPAQQLGAILQRADALMVRQQKVWGDVLKDLRNEQIFVRESGELTPSQLDWLEDYFLDQVLPVLTPLAICLLYTSPSPRDRTRSRMPSSA